MTFQTKSTTTVAGLVVLTLIAVACIVFTACHTMKGAGQDIKAAGQGIENAATK